MTFEDLAREPYISLTTFKRDGTAVSTPVWVAGEDGQLLVWTAADSWKVRRIKRNGHVRVAPCNARGKPHGEALDGMATVLPESSHVEELEGEKYGWRMIAIGTLTRFGRFIKREPTPESVMLTITPATEDRTEPSR
jgi:PPOX class probable F420-dependent enzyme